MRLTTKGRYAVTAMLDLTLRSGAGPMSAPEISKRHKISLPYLEQLCAKLSHHGLVESVHGPGGGYYLGRMPDDFSIADIIGAVDEPTDSTLCRGKLNCRDGERCMTHYLWADLNSEIARYLGSISLSRLAASQRERGASDPPPKVVQPPRALVKRD